MWLALLLAPGVAWADAAAFDKGVEEARELVQKGRGPAAHKLLDGLLEEHARQPWVHARHAEVLELMKRCVFLETRGEVDARKAIGELVEGEVLSYSKATGRLRVRYGKEGFRDLSAAPGGSGNLRVFHRVAPKAFRVTDDGGLLHTAAFTGAYKVTLRGPEYPGAGIGPIVLVCADGDECYQVVFGTPRPVPDGRWVPPCILHRVAKEEDERVARREETIAAGGRPFQVTVDVSTKGIKVSHNNRAYLSCRKRADLWGHVILYPNCKEYEIILDGTFEPSWAQGHLDRVNGERWAEFEKTYDPRQHVPAWLLDGPAAAPVTLAVRDGRTWPGALDDAARAAVTQATLLSAAGKHAEAQLVVAEASTLPEAARLYLDATLLRAAGDAEAALPLCLRVVELDPDFAPARLVAAALLSDLRRPDDAARAYGEMLARYPGDADLHAIAARFLLRLARFGEARQVLRQASAAGLSSELLARTDALVAKAEHGPPWPRAFEKQSEHYHVVSDIGQKICYEAARLLESAYGSYAARLEQPGGAGRERFRVYLFSGREGFEIYCRDVLGRTARADTAGLYSADLKQLLIWNLPRRDEMLRTIRHEGFHQYLDRIMEDPPLWFNEGLAEYYEVVETNATGDSRFGKARPEHLRTLANGRIPLATFLYESDRAFMAAATQHYAQAWAFVHFLRHAPEGPPLFERFWDAFKTIPGHRKAVDHALEGTTLVALELHFREHLDSLRTR